MADYQQTFIFILSDFLFLGTLNLKEVIIDAPLYLPSRHTLLLNLLVHMLSMLNILKEAFIEMIYHFPAIFKVSNLMCTIGWQHFLSDLDVDPDSEPAHYILPLH